MEVLYPRCAGLDVHSRCVNACVRIAAGRKVTTEHREFATTTAGLLELAAWLTEAGCTHVAMEATGVYWKPVWHDMSEPQLRAKVRRGLLGSGNMKRTPHHLARPSLSLGACLPRARSTAAVKPPPCPMRSEPEGRIDSNVR